MSFLSFPFLSFPNPQWLQTLAFHTTSNSTWRNIVVSTNVGPFSEAESQPTSKTTPARPWQSLICCLGCSHLSCAFSMPTSSAPDSPVLKGGRWLSGIQWETKADKGNMSLSLSCFSTGAQQDFPSLCSEWEIVTLLSPPHVRTLCHVLYPQSWRVSRIILPLQNSSLNKDSKL